MGKLVIQIPCFNEEAVLAETVSTLPRTLPGIDCIEWMVIDDGSSDRTVEVAFAAGVDHVLRMPVHGGLARAFQAGVHAALALGADYIVNTDADGQYPSEDIPKLLAPLLSGRARIAIGTRPIAQMEHFSPLKRKLQKLGSYVVSLAAGTRVPDATSGFRAFTADAAEQLIVLSDYTYTLETIIQAGHAGFPIACVDIGVHVTTRPSRLMRGSTEYILRSVYTLARLGAHYTPLRFFFAVGAVPLLVGMAAVSVSIPTGREGLLIAGFASMLAAVLIWCTGALADLMAANRRYAEEARRQLAELRRAHREPGHRRAPWELRELISRPEFPQYSSERP